MPLPTKVPLDRYRYDQHCDSRKYHADISPGSYVYVQKENGEVWVLQDGLHRHPQILGDAKPAAAAGELVIGPDGAIKELNNLSGTFRFGPETLGPVVEWLTAQGATIPDDAVRGYDLEY